ncbi:MAG TPA: glycosyltransferase family 2 protein [Bdellovibrionota bacterium]|nr:glycosyltransferase family 2 protein [Bdellovibrionota bacterium]
MKELCIVVPIFNDGDLARSLCTEIERIFAGFFGAGDLPSNLEVLFIDDGSTNSSLKSLLETRSQFPFVRVVSLSRNFGQQAALTCGYWHSNGRLTAVLDVDMQDHPKFLPEMIRKMRAEGSAICQGVRKRRRDSVFKRWTSEVFKRVIYRSIGSRVPANHSTLRIFDRKAIEEFRKFGEHGRFVPGIESLLGFKRSYVEVEHTVGTRPSSYNFRRRLRLATDAIVIFSELPMQMIVGVSFLLSIAGICFGVVIVVQRFMKVEMLPGWASLISVLLVGFGLIGLCMGVLGFYLVRILREVQGRPIFSVDTIYPAAGGE